MLFTGDIMLRGNAHAGVRTIGRCSGMLEVVAQKQHLYVRKYSLIFPFVFHIPVLTYYYFSDVTSDD